MELLENKYWKKLVNAKEVVVACIKAASKEQLQQPQRRHERQEQGDDSDTSSGTPPGTLTPIHGDLDRMKELNGAVDNAKKAEAELLKPYQELARILQRDDKAKSGEAAAEPAEHSHLSVLKCVAAAVDNAIHRSGSKKGTEPEHPKAGIDEGLSRHAGASESAHGEGDDADIDEPDPDGINDALSQQS